MEECEKVNLTTFGRKRKDQAKRNGKIPVQPGIKESKCFFCKKKQHMKKECSKI